MAAIKSNNEAINRQARIVFDRRDENRLGNRNPAILSALKAFQHLANQNYGKAYYPLLKLSIEEDQYYPPNLSQKAFDWCFANQANQDGELCDDLSAMYIFGVGVDKDIEPAVYWTRKAANQGYARAQCSLGFMYENGEGVPQDYEEAGQWYRLVADQGYADAQNFLGRMYCHGVSVPKNHKEGVRGLQLAADKGNPGALEALKIIIEAQRGIEQVE